MPPVPAVVAQSVVRAIATGSTAKVLGIFPNPELDNIASFVVSVGLYYDGQITADDYFSPGMALLPPNPVVVTAAGTLTISKVTQSRYET